jgi:hypothetical protein
MKTKAIVATLLIAAAASADARFASPYPRKAIPPDESGHWIVINGNSWSHDVNPTSPRRVRVAAATGPERRKIVAK